MDIAILVIAFLVILLGAELFTNGIEWFGRKLNLAQGAVGSVLAAVGTALPETMIPVIAIIFGSGSEAAHDVGVGAILGAPFMLSTLAMFVTGVGVIAFRKRRATDTRMEVDTGVLVHDIRYFLIAYGLAIATAFLPPTARRHPLRRRGRPDRHLRLVREGPLRRGGRGAPGRPGAAPLPPDGPRRPPRGSGRAAAAHRQPPGHRRARLHRRRRLAVRRTPSSTWRPRSASASCCSRSSSPRSPPSCPRSSTP